jgi:gamma-glutamylcyclotransferase (GGCT)/AIG2-like uncharacterized protein YtfP
MLGWLKTNTARVFQATHHPDAQWFAEAAHTNALTPDLWVLQRYDFQLIFVYGTQMSGHPQHELVMEHGAYAAAAYTAQQYTLWKKRLGRSSFPIALQGSGWRTPDWRTPPLARVQGELYAIEAKQLLELDKHFQNTLEFDRKRIPLLIPYHELVRAFKPRTGMQQFIEDSLRIPNGHHLVTADTKVKLVKAWTYIGKSDFWTDQLAHYFHPVNTYTPRYGWLGDYYAFTRSEYGK